MLHRLKQHWKKLAAHLGFTEEEIDDVVRAGAGDVCREIQMFMRIWWMPDCGQGATQSILSQGIYVPSHHILLAIYIHFLEKVVMIMYCVFISWLN